MLTLQQMTRVFFLNDKSLIVKIVTIFINNN